MKFTLTSIAGSVVSTENAERVTIPTKDGEITVLTSHEPLFSALKPGVLTYVENGNTMSFVIGGGVLECHGNELNVIADMVEDGASLDTETIQSRKSALKREMDEYRKNHETADMDQLLEMEYEYLKESAKEQLVTRMAGNA